MYQRPQAPLSIGGVLDDGFQLARACFPVAFPIALVGAIISQIPNTMISDTPTELPGAGFWLALLLSFVVSVFVFIALVRMVSTVAEGGQMTPGEALGGSAGYLLATVVCGIVYGLIVMLGMVLLIVPGVLFGLSLAFAPYLVITDDAGPMDALGRSHRLVWGNWWRTAAVLSVVVFIAIVLYVLVILVMGLSLFFAEEGSAVVRIVEFVLTAAVTAVLSPVMYSFFISILNDLKLRSEGEDLEARIGAIGNE